MKEWVNITTIGQSGLYEVELDIHSSQIRHRKLYLNDAAGPWKHGEPANKAPDADGSISGDEETFNNGQGW